MLNKSRHGIDRRSKAHYKPDITFGVYEKRTKLISQLGNTLQRQLLPCCRLFLNLEHLLTGYPEILNIIFCALTDHLMQVM